MRTPLPAGPVLLFLLWLHIFEAQVPNNVVQPGEEMETNPRGWDRSQGRTRNKLNNKMVVKNQQKQE